MSTIILVILFILLVINTAIIYKVHVEHSGDNNEYKNEYRTTIDVEAEYENQFAQYLQNKIQKQYVGNSQELLIQRAEIEDGEWTVEFETVEESQ